MKRWTLLALALCLILLPGPALGAQSPLEEVSRNRVVYPEDSAVKLVSYYATLTVRGSTSVNAVLTLENRLDTPVEIYVGTPYPMDNGYQVDRPQAWCEGQSLPLHTRKKAADAGEGMPEDWYGWKLAFAPKQTRVLTVAFSTDTKIESDGTRCVIFPLHYLRKFAEGTDYIQVVADMDYSPPYIYDPAPVPLPQQIESGGLIWSFPDGKYPDQIVLRFKPTAQVIERYLGNLTAEDNDAKLILSAYKLGQYREAADLIDAYLDAHSEHTNAMLTLKSICLQKLMRLDEALAINEKLLADPGFEGMNTCFQNRIIYENAWMYSALEKEPAEILEYLTAQQGMVDEDSLFAQWLDQEIWRLTPRPTPTPEPVAEPADAPPAQPEKEGILESLLKETVTVLSFDIPIVYLIGGGVLVILVLIIVIAASSRKKNRRGRYYYR
jgi:hypothetical protein